MRIKTSRVPKELQEITRHGVRFFCENFLHPRTYGRLEEIHVKFVKSQKGDVIATCGPHPSQLDERTRPTRFVIEWDDKYRDILVRQYMHLLFHELTHMRQYAQGELRDLVNGSANWRGKNYPAPAAEDEEIEYWMQPWEVEAYGMENTVYQVFRRKHPEYGLKRFSKKYNGRRKTGWNGVKELEKAL